MVNSIWAAACDLGMFPGTQTGPAEFPARGSLGIAGGRSKALTWNWAASPSSDFTWVWLKGSGFSPTPGKVLKIILKIKIKDWIRIKGSDQSRSKLALGTPRDEELSVTQHTQLPPPALPVSCITNKALGSAVPWKTPFPAQDLQLCLPDDHPASPGSNPKLSQCSWGESEQHQVHQVTFGFVSLPLWAGCSSSGIVFSQWRAGNYL